MKVRRPVFSIPRIFDHAPRRQQRVTKQRYKSSRESPTPLSALPNIVKRNLTMCLGRLSTELLDGTSITGITGHITHENKQCHTWELLTTDSVERRKVAYVYMNRLRSIVRCFSTSCSSIVFIQNKRETITSLTSRVHWQEVYQNIFIYPEPVSTKNSW